MLEREGEKGGEVYYPPSLSLWTEPQKRHCGRASPGNFRGYVQIPGRKLISYFSGQSLEDALRCLVSHVEAAEGGAWGWINKEESSLNQDDKTNWGWYELWTLAHTPPVILHLYHHISCISSCIQMQCGKTGNGSTPEVLSNELKVYKF